MTVISNTYKILVLTLLISIGNVLTNAQNSTSSPYSAFGIGLLTPQEDATSAGMGHAGIALSPNDWINITNPAGIGNLDSLTFHFNAQLKWFYGHIKPAERGHQSVYRTNIDGITFGFRSKPWWATCIGYAPYSTVGYNILDPYQYIAGTQEKYTIKHQGSGGLSRAFFNNAFTFFNHISLGVSAGAIWGSITKTETAMFPYGETIYNTKKYTMNNLFFEYGVQFNFNIGKDNNFRFGAIFNEKTNMRSSYDHIVSNDISNNLFFDDVTPLDGEFAVPRSYGVGFSYNRRKFTATIDYRENFWGKLKNIKFRETARYIDNYSIGGGAEWACGKREDPFYKRLRWRLGCHYETSYLGITNKKVIGTTTIKKKVPVYDPEYATTIMKEIDMKIPVLDQSGANLSALTFTAGITIPLGRWNNAINIGYEYRKHGTNTNGLMKEKFQNIKIALNIREIWFVKSKFD